MTREEAIEILEANRPDPCYQMLREAVDFAVDALKAQGTCEDAVSRQTLQKELALYSIDDVTSEDEAGYNRAINDVQKMVLHLPSAQPEKAQLSGENATFDCISRQTVIDAIDDIESEVADGDGFQYAKWREYFCDLPSAQPEVRLIDYQDCSNAMLKMWIDNVVTDGEYNRIMDKLNAHWGKKDG